MGNSSVNFDESGSGIIGAIQDGVKTSKVEVKPGEFTDRPVYMVPDRKQESPLGVSSLTGLIDYVNGGIDKDTRKSLFVQVDGPTKVVLRNQITDERDDRFTPLIATADVPSITFDSFVPKEEMMIQIQARFVDNDARKNLLQKLGTIVADESLEQADDGVTQQVKVQQGIKRQELAINNPVTLRPFRTFIEVEQPESPFIVRLKKSEERGILVALFESDGGQWRNAARLAIKEYLIANIKADAPKVAVLA